MYIEGAIEEMLDLAGDFRPLVIFGMVLFILVSAWLWVPIISIISILYFIYFSIKWILYKYIGDK